ncbi:MAG: sigma-54-dependent Fis family transcriptional regulator [Flavobacteriales bacterium]|nr:sigma-54-dependent Fis family transcriptional regulator [Flavobacteriales bacterium]MCB9449299.1 sigma-54-dependent Fis family transcriptional regulator [Flavobacteriales bacterium]
MRIFIVEDDPVYARFLQHLILLNPDHEVTIFHDAPSLYKALPKKPEVVTLDYNLPGTTGAQILERIRSTSPETDVVIVSAQEDISTAVSLLRSGAFDYVVKDDSTKDRLWITLSNISQKQELLEQVHHLQEEVEKKYVADKNIIGDSDAIHKIHQLIKKAAETNITVSITGETGTGKELVAKAIHYNSSRKKKPFVAVNVTAIPADLMESELFGHEKGSFTGAHTRRIGKFEEAHQGTIFLDEIGEMDLNMQAKLLRVLQEKEITRIGGNEVVKVDVRVLVATHRNLLEEVKAGRFREDLFYRLLGLPVQLPPLRDRGNDIILIARHYLDTFCKENNLKKMTISPEAQQKLMAYGFPGNIRELKASVELAAVMSNGDVLEASDLNLDAMRSPKSLLEDNMTLKQYTEMIIKHYLERYDQNVLLVAKKLDIGKSTLYRMLQAEKSSQH